MNTIEERRFGFLSVLKVKCSVCLAVNDVPTGKKHRNKTMGPPMYDINSKAILGKLALIQLQYIVCVLCSDQAAHVSVTAVIQLLASSILYPIYCDPAVGLPVPNCGAWM